MTDEELRLAIGQQIGLDWLVRLGIERLFVDPLRSGDFYEGDLFENVLKLPATFWSWHRPEYDAVLAILAEIQRDPRWPEVIREVREAATRFAPPSG